MLGRSALIVWAFALAACLAAQWHRSSYRLAPLSAAAFRSAIPDINPVGDLDLRLDVAVASVDGYLYKVSVAHKLSRACSEELVSGWSFDGLQSALAPSGPVTYAWKPLFGPAVEIRSLDRGSGPTVSRTENATLVSDGDYKWVYENGRLTRLLVNNRLQLVFEGSGPFISTVTDSNANVVVKADWEPCGHLSRLVLGETSTSFHWRDRQLVKWSRSDGHVMVLDYSDDLIVNWHASGAPAMRAAWSRYSVEEGWNGRRRSERIPRVVLGPSGSIYEYANTADGVLVTAIRPQSEAYLYTSLVRGDYVLNADRTLYTSFIAHRH